MFVQQSYGIILRDDQQGLTLIETAYELKVLPGTSSLGRKFYMGLGRYKKILIFALLLHGDRSSVG